MLTKPPVSEDLCHQVSQFQMKHHKSKKVQWTTGPIRDKHISYSWLSISPLSSKLVYLPLAMFIGNKTRLAHRILFPLEVAVAAELAGWRMTGHSGTQCTDCSRHSAIIIVTMPISVEPHYLVPTSAPLSNTLHYSYIGRMGGKGRFRQMTEGFE